jgi:hypothetical protein
MASNFKILLDRSQDRIHLKLYGDFDGSSAHELLILLKNNSYGTLEICIQTEGLKHIHPFGLNIFYRGVRAINSCADRIVFTGKKAADLALP